MLYYIVFVSTLDGGWIPKYYRHVKTRIGKRATQHKNWWSRQGGLETKCKVCVDVCQCVCSIRSLVRFEFGINKDHFGGIQKWLMQFKWSAKYVPTYRNSETCRCTFFDISFWCVWVYCFPNPICRCWIVGVRSIHAFWNNQTMEGPRSLGGRHISVKNH